MKASPEAEPFSASEEIANTELPKKVDLRPHMTSIEDQGQTSSCVANATTGAFQYWIKRATNQELDLSRLFVYYNARWRHGDQDKDDGSYIQFAMESLSKFGVCTEEIWPFHKDLILQKPNANSYQSAATYKVEKMQKIPTELEKWKQCLAQGMPIVFGCILFDSFDECEQRGGVVPMPDPSDLTRKKHGGHSMCCVGYSDPEGVFIIRNSWGATWGDQGHCYMPYNYLMNPKFNDGDTWTFVPRIAIANPQETWSQTDTPVTNGGKGVDFLINSIEVAAYSEIAHDFFEAISTKYHCEIAEDLAKYFQASETNAFHQMESFDFSSLFTKKTDTPAAGSSEEDSSHEEGSNPDGETKQDS